MARACWGVYSRDPRMGCEINLLDSFPRAERRIDERARFVTDEHRQIARQFGREFFDGDRLCGYGGYHYHPRFWSGVVRRLRDDSRLPHNAEMLYVGRA